MPITLDRDEKNTLDKYHTHFLLLDDGILNRHLDDRPRSDFANAVCKHMLCRALTIIVEGGINTLEVIENDMRHQRPVIIIQGSGRLADVLGTLIEMFSKKQTLEYRFFFVLRDVTPSFSDDHLKSQLNTFLPELKEANANDRSRYISRIENIMVTENQQYLNIFKLERDSSHTDTIFKAVDRGTHAFAPNVQVRSIFQFNLIRRNKNVC